MTEPTKDPAAQRRIQAPKETPFGRAVAFLKSRTFQEYAESVVITLALPLIGRFLRPDDPFFVRSGFSWMVVPPILVALRHGFGPGVSSALLLVAMVIARHGGRRASLETLPSELLYGVTFLAMVVGQVSASTARKFAKLDTDHEHVRRQLEGFSRSYMLLELSHERLEQRAASRLSPLRAALGVLARELPAPGGLEAPALAGVGPKMLEVLAMYGRVQAATLAAVVDGVILPEPVASLGASAPVNPDDPLLRAALDSGEVAYAPAQADQEASVATTKLIVAVPLVDASGKRVAVVAIDAIPFVALEHANLRLLAVVAGWIADLVSPVGWQEELAGGRRAEFERRLDRAAEEARARKVPSAITAFSCRRGARGNEVLEQLVATDLRGTDMPLLLRTGPGDPVLVILMSLTDREGALAFRARIDRLAATRFGADLRKLGVEMLTWPIEGATQLDSLRAELAALLEGSDASRASLVQRVT